MKGELKESQNKLKNSAQNIDLTGELTNMSASELKQLHSHFTLQLEKITKKLYQKYDSEQKPNCVCCQEKAANIVFKDCGHVVSCDTCVLQLKQCPTCRKVISVSNYFKIYF